MTRQEFITLTQGVQPDLRRWLLALCCGNASRADDLAQETLISAYLSIDRLRSDESFRQWVMSIAADTAVKQLLSRGRQHLKTRLDHD